MRQAFIGALSELAGQDERIVLLTGDLGFTVVEAFARRWPKRFFNAGVAEQNLVGVATGLAEAGFIPFVYSIVTFASLRPFEFVRNGPVLHHLPVRIVAVGQGFDYGVCGPTHHGLEDLAVLRGQPGLTIVVPADRERARAALDATWRLDGPVYYRLAKTSPGPIPGREGPFALDRLEILHEGKDLLLVSIGTITSEVIRAATLLSEQGVSATVALVGALEPFPSDDLRRLLSRFRVAVTVEEHSVTGGLGSAIAELIACDGIACKLTRCGISGMTLESGSQSYLRRLHGLVPEAIAERALSAVQLTTS
jgi:transketolase